MYADKQELIELMQDISSKINVPTIGIGGGYAPLGTINFFDATVAPQDWLACDGSVYNIADYPQLAEWYATQHGASNFYGGNGTTTFAVPDLQGEFLRGTGTNSHTNQGSGANVGVHQDGTEFPLIGTNVNQLYAGNVAEKVPANKDKGWNANASGLGKNMLWSSQWSDVGADNVYTSRPTNTSFLICVKAVVAGEVYSTEERVVGTWIDGKKIYQKTYNCGALPNSNTKTIPLGVTNVDNILALTGIAINTDNGKARPLPYSNAGINSSASEYNITIGASKTDNIILIDTARNYTDYSKSFITIRYTKTV